MHKKILHFHTSGKRVFTGRKVCAVLLGGAVSFCALLSCPGLVIPSSAETLTADGHPYDQAAEAERLAEPVDSNSIPDWPSGPSCSAEGAIVMDMDTGAILYQKNIHEQLYPASTTKMLTCLIAAENLDLDDTVTFSEEAISSVPADGSNIGMDVGETITVEQCLYGILVGSANECANAIAEKTAGSVSAFVDLMNEKAAELGCTDSHFVNANGLFDEDHYTSPHDLALIAQAFFGNATLLEIGNTPRYHFTATSTQPDDFWITNKHELITGEISCDGVIGGKTGYTGEAKECLVTGCQRGSVRLVCVVMKEDSPKQFTDTVSLFDYGYSRFQHADASEDTRFTPAAADFFRTGEDLFGSMTPVFSVAEGSMVTLPDTADFEDLSVAADGDTITYTFGSGDSAVTVGTATLVRSADTSADTAAGTTSGSRFSGLKALGELYITSSISGIVYVNVFSFVVTIGIIGAVLIVILELRSFIAFRRRRRSGHRRNTPPRPKGRRGEQRDSMSGGRGYELPEEFGSHYYD